MFQKLREEGANEVHKAKAKVNEVKSKYRKRLGKGSSDQNFDEDAIPPNWDIAEKHRQAWTVGHSDKRSDDVCPCCTRKIDRIALKINGHEKDLAFLGSGIPLYFDFIKGCIAILLIFFVTSGDYNLITNYQYGKDCAVGKSCPTQWSNQLSLANKRHNTSLVNIQQSLNFVSIVVLCVALQFLRRGQREIAEDVDNTQIFASDYSILVQGIHNIENVTDIDQDLLEFFLNEINKYPLTEAIDQAEKVRELQARNANQPYKPLRRITVVNPVYRLNDLFDKKSQQDKILVQKQALLTKLYNQGYQPGSEDIKQMQDYRDLQEQIDALERDMDNLADKFLQGQEVKEYFLSMAVVSFQWQADRDRFLKEHKLTAWQKLTGKQSQLLYNANLLTIIEPAEPTDIFWQNLHYTAKEKRIRQLLGNLITLVVLSICTVAIYFLTELQQYSVDEQNNEMVAQQIQNGSTKSNDALQTNYLIKGLSISASLLIIVINQILAFVIAKVSDYQGHSTQTNYNVSLASKSSIAQFLNTSLITFLIATFITKNIYGNGGLVATQTTVFFTNAIIPILTDFIDVGGKIKLFLQYKERSKEEKSVYTQQQLNIFLERPPFDISARYAMILKNMYVTAFYATIIPISLVISCLQLYLFAWLERYNIVRRRTIKYNYGSDLSYQMIDCLEFVLPIYCATNLYWEYSFSEQHVISTWAILGIVIGLLNAALPMQWFNEQIFPAKEFPESTIPYQEAEVNFLTDYARENPATGEKARELFAQRIKKHAEVKKAILVGQIALDSKRK